MEDTKNYKGKNIPASVYYYGVLSNTWDNMLYWDAVKDRRDRARKLFFELMNFKETRQFDDLVREHKVYKAWKDNEKLLDERSLVI
jgi:soluble lytic murein transglycosylase-like protein